MNNKYGKDLFLKDLLSSTVVFLVALPLCMGIALASGVPPIVGLMSGIIGGVVIGIFTGSPLQVSGPAAGLAVIVYELVQTEGLAGLAMITLFAGLFQVLFSFLKAGPLFRAISPSVVKGMLAGIGVLIFSSQFHVMLDDTPKENGFMNLITIPSAILKVFDVNLGINHVEAGMIGLLTIFIIIAWNYVRDDIWKNPIPAPLIAIFAAGAITYGANIDIKLVEIPANLTATITEGFMWNNFAGFKVAYIWEGLIVAFIATTETLLCVTATDKMKVGHKSDYNKELFAQGIGNALAGLLGAIPITGVIVRSSANVDNGGETRGATIMHGMWLLILLFIFPQVLAFIPKAALAAILVYIGFKLVDLKAIKEFAEYGKSEAAIYLITIGGVVFINLLAGVVIGFGLSLLKLLWQVHGGHVEHSEDENESKFVFSGEFSFVNLPRVAHILESKNINKKLILDMSAVSYMDHAIDELIEGLKHKAEKQNKEVEYIKCQNCK
jgi:MFS superfamily sulfate permease-like transporter